MGRASALLRRVATPRVAAFAVLAVALGAYYAWHEQLVDLSKWWNVAFLALCLIPSIFALVYLALPYRTSHGLLLLALALLVLVVLLELAELQSLSSFAKLALMTTLGFWFLEYFESVLWVALVALLIPWVDAFSVWRGPTGHIVEEEPGLFDRVAFEFPHPGEPSAALLGPPDLLFFALFLAAAARWNLRVGWTFVALTLSLGLTLVIGVLWESAGLPALPGLAFGFLIPNADLLWREFQRWRRERGEPADRPPDGAGPRTLVTRVVARTRDGRTASRRAHDAPRRRSTPSPARAGRARRERGCRGRTGTRVPGTRPRRSGGRRIAPGRDGRFGRGVG